MDLEMPEISGLVCGFMGKYTHRYRIIKSLGGYTMERRYDFGYYTEHTLPSRFWEPQPDEEDLKRMEAEYEGSELDSEPVPFE